MKYERRLYKRPWASGGDRPYRYHVVVRVADLQYFYIGFHGHTYGVKLMSYDVGSLRPDDSTQLLKSASHEAVFTTRDWYELVRSHKPRDRMSDGVYRCISSICVQR